MNITLLYTLQLLPTALAQDLPLGLSEKVANLFSTSLVIGAVLALGILVYAGITYTTAAGNATRQGEAKKWIWAAISGLALLFGSFVILTTINPNITGEGGTGIADLFFTQQRERTFNPSGITVPDQPPLPQPPSFACYEECTAYYGSSADAVRICNTLGLSLCGSSTPPEGTSPPTGDIPPGDVPPPIPPSQTGSYGAGKVGPSEEPCSTNGIVVNNANYPNAINNGPNGATFLIKGGTYTKGFSVPANATVKPFDCEVVRIRATIDMNENGATLAGLDIKNTSGARTLTLIEPSDNPLRNITLRHMRISGGGSEALRIAKNVDGVIVTGSELSGGKNHPLKLHKEDSHWSPRNIRITNNVFHRRDTDGIPQQGDLIQTQWAGSGILIESNTFSHNRFENAIDLKNVPQSGTIIRRNYFDGATIRQRDILVQGTRGNTIIENNLFDNTATIGLGAHQNASWAIIRNNIFRNSRGDDKSIRLRRTAPNPEITGNIWEDGGELQLGLGTANENPDNPIITGNTFRNVKLIDRINGAFVCRGNTISGGSGWPSRCSQ